MKYLFVFLLVVISIGGFGQRDISRLLANSKDTICFDNVCCFDDSCWVVNSSTRTDTIHCLMLVCDTIGYPHTSVGSLLPSSQAWNEGRMVWWQYGYEVIQYSQASVFDGGYQIRHVVAYLDQNKKPLPKSLAVWMSKEIK